MKKVKVALFASGTGSNFQAIIEQAIENKLECDVALLVCDKPGAKVIDIANDYDIPTFVFDPKSYITKKEYEQEIVKRLQMMNVEWIFLAGYMRIIGSTLLNAYETKIVNIHPSMLPAFPGKDAIGQAFHAGVKTTGVTVHYVDAGIDTGPIIAQESVEVLLEDTRETLQKRIQRVEHKLYPQVINQLINNKRGVFL